MRIVETEEDLAEGTAFLCRVEPRFAHAVEKAGPPPLRRRTPGFPALLEVLISQQLSVAAADTIWRRVVEAGASDPAVMLAMEEDALRGCGLSRPKIRYAKTMAEAVRSGALRLDSCGRASPEEATEMLTKIKGIGPWTAEIYLMFCVGHADVFAPKDLALQESARLLFRLGERPAPEVLAGMARAWSPWRAVAARILWSYYRVAKGREGLSG